MTPRQFFDGLPHGAITACSKKIGYGAEHISYVINGKRKCSQFFAQCLSEYSKGKISIQECDVGPK